MRSQLWIDPDPNAQLTLIWLLDYLRPHANAASELTLVAGGPPDRQWHAGRIDRMAASGRQYPGPSPRNRWHGLAGLSPADAAGLVQAARRRPRRPAAASARACRNCSKNCRWTLTGLGATRNADAGTDIGWATRARSTSFPATRRRNQRRVFGYWEVGALLDGLAHCPEPAVSGLDEGPFTLEMHDDRDRHERYRQSRLKLTALGEAILARSEDFSRHNPIHRWWGGTELTNDRLWRWDPANRALIEPA